MLEASVSDEIRARSEAGETVPMAEVLASIDEDGFWYLHGRSDDTLNIAGKRIGPAEIESVAVSLHEVIMAAAVGVPDEVKGEAIALFLVPAPGVEPDDELRGTLAAFCRENLAGYKCPRSIDFREELPRHPTGKLYKRLLKDEYWAAAGRAI